MIIYLVYVVANIYYIGFLIITLPDTSRRAGILALINIIPLFGSLYLTFLTDIIGTP